MTRDETLKIMQIIDNESKGFMPVDKANASLRVDTWHSMLQTYDYSRVQQATMIMIARFVYGTAPKIGDLFAILAPKKEKENIGAEFAERFWYLLTSKGKEAMGHYILEEFGEIGYQVYRNLKPTMDYMNVNDAGTIKAQIRTSFNSMHEREAHGESVNLPFKQNKTIIENLKNNGLGLFLENKGDEEDYE